MRVLSIAVIVFILHAGVNDLLNVCGYLLNLTAHQIETLGRILGLHDATVTNSRGADVAERRNSIMRAWLLKQDNVKETSWSALETALRSPHLGQNGIADTIRREEVYCINCII